MPYINKNKAGLITGMFAAKQYDGQEFIEESEAECVAFVNRNIIAEKTMNLIQNKLINMSIQQLKIEGVLPSEYPEIETKI